MSKERRLRRLKYEAQAKTASQWDVKKRDDQFLTVTVRSDNGGIVKYLVRREPATN